MGDTLGFVSLYSHAWEWTFSTNGLMTVRASSAHGTGKKKTSEEEGVGPAMPDMAAPPGLIGSAHHCRRS